MDFLYFLESIRIPVLNEIMLLVTRFGEETAFLVVALILFWCVDKYKGYYIMSVGFVGNMIGQFMKISCRIPRPWVKDPDFSILEQAREAATGYSFPSGHSQSAVGTFGGIAYTAKKSWIRWACISIAVLVPLSRMYIGVHTPADVLVGSGISLALIFLMKPLVMDHRKQAMPYLIGTMLVLSLGYLSYVSFYPFPADVDPDNLSHAISNAYTFLGCLAGLLVVYTIDERWINFSTKAAWWIQILKVLGGLGVVLLVKSGLKTPLNAVFGELVGRMIRYFLIVVVAGILWPLTFRWFAGLEKKGNGK